MQVGSKTIADSLMHTFTNRICLGIFDRGWNILDPVPCQHGYERCSDEFFAIVVYASIWSGVPGQPFVFEFHCYMCCCFVFQTDELGEIGHRVNDCESVDGELVLSDSNVPGTDEIASDFGPWEPYRFPRRQLPVLTIGFVPLAGVASGNVACDGTAKERMREVRRNRIVKARGTRMIQNEMVPTNNVVEETVWDHDFEPGRCWLEADQVDTTEGTIWVLLRELLVKLEQPLILLLEVAKAKVINRTRRLIGMVKIALDKVRGKWIGVGCLGGHRCRHGSRNTR